LTNQIAATQLGLRVMQNKNTHFLCRNVAYNEVIVLKMVSCSMVSYSGGSVVLFIYVGTTTSRT